VCVDPDEVGMQGRSGLEYYSLVKGLMMSKAANTIDKYAMLEKVTEAETNSLPVGMAKDEWLLDLKDEEELMIRMIVIQREKRSVNKNYRVRIPNHDTTIFLRH